MQIPNIVQWHPNDISGAPQDCPLLILFRLSVWCTPSLQLHAVTWRHMRMAKRSNKFIVVVSAVLIDAYRKYLAVLRMAIYSVNRGQCLSVPIDLTKGPSG